MSFPYSVPKLFNIIRFLNGFDWLYFYQYKVQNFLYPGGGGGGGGGRIS